MVVRKVPEPNGRPGYLRVDTVHLGDKDGRKGVYVVNMVERSTKARVRNIRTVPNAFQPPGPLGLPEVDLLDESGLVRPRDPPHAAPAIRPRPAALAGVATFTQRVRAHTSPATGTGTSSPAFRFH